MRKRHFLIGCLLSLCGITAYGDSSQVLTINGQTVQKVVNKITFDGNNVVLGFDGGTSQAYDMSTVTIDFIEASNINSLETFRFDGIIGDELNISGLEAGTNISIYDTTGKCLVNTKTNGISESISLGSLRNGVYILRAGNKVVKFVKR